MSKTTKMILSGVLAWLIALMSQMNVYLLSLDGDWSRWDWPVVLTAFMAAVMSGLKDLGAFVAKHGDGGERDKPSQPAEPPQSPSYPLDGVQHPARPVREPVRAPKPLYPAKYPHVYGKKSTRLLEQGHEHLQALFRWALPRSRFDWSIVEVARTVEKQLANIESGASKTMDSRHLERPAMAVDFYILNPDYDPNTMSRDMKYYMGRDQVELDAYIEVLTLLKHGAEVLRSPITSGGLDWGWDYFHVQLDRKHYPRGYSVLDDANIDFPLT